MGFMTPSPPSSRANPFLPGVQQTPRHANTLSPNVVCYGSIPPRPTDSAGGPLQVALTRCVQAASGFLGEGACPLRRAPTTPPKRRPTTSMEIGVRYHARYA